MRYVVADDLTGACEAALAYVRVGSRAFVSLDACDVDAPSLIRADDRGAGDLGALPAAAIVFDLDVRERTAAQAYERTHDLVRRLPTRVPSDLVMKIDSTLRGFPGEAARAVFAAYPQAFAIVAPSVPAQGRTFQRGTVYVRGIARPGTAGSVFERGATLALGTVRAGPVAIGDAIDAARASGARLAIADAETDADLDALVAGVGARRDVVWIGSGGVIAALARADSRACRAPLPRASEPQRTRRTLFIVGSAEAVTQEQLARLARDVPMEFLDPRSVLACDAAIDAAIARCARALLRDGVAVVALAPQPRVADSRLRAAFVDACAPLVRDGEATNVVLCGGDIARAFCDAMGIRRLETIDEIVPGVPRSYAWDAPFVLVTKAGGFGAADAFEEVRRVLAEASHR